MSAIDKNPKPIYEFFLDVPSGTSFRPGDSIGIFPRNCDSVVEKLIQHQSWTNHVDVPFKIDFLPGSKKKKFLPFIPEGSTIRRVLTECVDLDKPPSKIFLLSLIKYCTREETLNTIRILCAKEMMATYTREIMEKRVSIVDILIGLDVKIPFHVLFENCNRLLPRPYSIINGVSRSPGRIRMAFSWDSERPGITTTMLRSIITKDTKTPIHFYVRQPTTFRLEVDDVHKDLLMIGPGLGVIPFLGMLEEVQDNKSNNQRLLYTTWRNQGIDDVFKKDLQSSSTELHCSYTRDNEEPKRHVQDLLLSTAKAVSSLLHHHNSKVFICGESKVMIPAIECSLARCLAEQHQLPETEAVGKIKELKQQKRIVIEPWF